jgi:hypothetical protein
MYPISRKAAAVAIATVLGVTAGGIAWAESSSTPGTVATAPGAAASTHPHPHDHAGGLAARMHGFGRMHGLGRMHDLARHLLHGEAVVQTRKGFVTMVFARGTVSAIGADSISVKSADGVVTTFAIDAKTKARSDGQAVAIGTVHTGDKIGVFGTKTGGATATARMIREIAR